MAIGDRPFCSCCGDLDVRANVQHHNDKCAHHGERSYGSVTITYPRRLTPVRLKPKVVESEPAQRVA